MQHEKKLSMRIFQQFSENNTNSRSAKTSKIINRLDQFFLNWYFYTTNIINGRLIIRADILSTIVFMEKEG